LATLFSTYALSADGVMAARMGTAQLTRAAPGELRFDPDQAERIRSEVRRRMEESREPYSTICG
jgi:hypothetical protein